MVNSIGIAEIDTRITIHELVHEFLKQYAPPPTPIVTSRNPKIWVYWAQGRENVPPLVDTCLNQLYALHDSSDVVFLDDRNIRNYVDIPDYVYEKVFQNKTHFSDVLRVNLLANYGGIWIDATCYCSSSIIPLYEKTLDTGFFAYSLKKGENFLLSNGFMASRQGEIIPELLRGALHFYWKYNNQLLHYLIFHMIFEALYNLNPHFRKCWDSRYRQFRSDYYALQSIWHENFDIIEFKHLMKKSIVNKLTYKYDNVYPNTYLEHVLTNKPIVTPEKQPTITELLNKRNEAMLKLKLNPLEQIGNITLDLSCYTGNDGYSEGNMEDVLLEIVKNTSDFDSIIKSDNRFEIIYHLSPIRQNLLCNFDFTGCVAVLELGAGCGSITGLLCEKFEHVTVIEQSKKRGTVLAHRNKERKNLDVIIGNINDVKLEKKYDVVTLIGVLEYAGTYTFGANPYKDFLTHVKTFLKPDGQLVLAIENRFGLKYWAGFREDHLDMYFTGIEGYEASQGVRTFSKMELENLLASAGFQQMQFYYPFPDYKFPSVIFSDECDFISDEIELSFGNQDRNRLKFFDEIKVLRDLVKEKKLAFFANSFLVFAKQ